MKIGDIVYAIRGGICKYKPMKPDAQFPGGDVTWTFEGIGKVRIVSINSQGWIEIGWADAPGMRVPYFYHPSSFFKQTPFLKLVDT